MAPPLLTIAGLPVPGGRYGSHDWPLTLGLTAPDVQWALPPDVAAAVLALRETEIVYTVAGAKPLTIKRVVVVNEAPSTDPLVRVVRLSNVLWYLPRKRAFRSYNVRVPSSGERRLLQVDGVPAEASATVEVPTYAQPSLKGDGFNTQGTPYTAAEVVADMESVVALAPTLAGQTPIKFRDESNVASRSAFLPQDVQVDAAANVGLAQALGLVGGLDVYVDVTGEIVVVNAAMGAEKAAVEKAVPYSLQGHGLIRWISMGSVAPKSIRVGFTREVEVRADGRELTENSTQSRIATQEPVVSNVIKVDDLTLGGVTDPEVGRAGATVVQGTYVQVDAYLRAINAKGDQILNGIGAPPISRDMICRSYHGGLLQRLYVVGTGGTPNYLWSARIGSIMRDYRMTWRLNPRFAVRCVPGSIKPLRAALLDPATGQRQPSTIYADYCRRPTIQGIPSAAQGGWNVNVIPPNVGQAPGPTKTYADTSFPDNPFPLTGCTQTSPALLQVIDPITGVFRVAFQADPSGFTGETSPALVQAIPSNDVEQVNSGLAEVAWVSSELVRTFRVAFIFSAIPWGPNNEASLQFFDVTPAKALERLGVSAGAVTPTGPVFELRVGPGLSTARIAWDDSQRNAILGLFTAGGGGASLVPVNQTELQDYSEALGAILMSAFLDHYEGAADVAWSPDVRPIGSMGAVSFKLDGEGRAYTGITCAQVVPPPSIESLLTPASRAILFRALGSKP